MKRINRLVDSDHVELYSIDNEGLPTVSKPSSSRNSETCRLKVRFSLERRKRKIKTLQQESTLTIFHVRVFSFLKFARLGLKNQGEHSSHPCTEIVREHPN